MAETNLPQDAYKFRTPSLRNVALTAPYGHNGAYPTLAEIIRHHTDPARTRAAWTPAQANLPDVPWLAAADFAIRQDKLEMARQTAAIDLRPIALTEAEIADLVAFLNALTGETARYPPHGPPRHRAQRPARRLNPQDPVIIGPKISPPEAPTETKSAYPRRIITPRSATLVPVASVIKRSPASFSAA